MIGARGLPQGVKATIYHPEDCMETGVLFLLEGENWKKTVDPKEKKRQKRCIIPIPMKTEYDLLEILSGYGFELLNEALAFEESNARIDLLGVRSNGHFLRVDVLENHINLGNFIAVAKKDKQNLDIFDK